MYSIEDFTVLGSFDPATFFLRLHVEPPPEGTTNRADRFQFVEQLPPSLLAHEFVHFMQGCATASGVREFMLALDLFHNGLLLIKEAATAGPVLRVPLMRHSEHYSKSERFKQSFGVYSLIARTAALYLGGHRVPMKPNRSSGPDDTTGWLRSEKVTVFGMPTERPRSFADMEVFDGRRESVLLGSIHLSEAFAKCIEMVQRNLTGEIGDAADTQEQLRDATTDQRRMADPYFIVQFIFGNLARSIPTVFEKSSIEELCCLIDLALMLDPVVAHTKLKIEQHFRGISGARLAAEYSPIESFLSLLTLYIEFHHELPHLDAGWRQPQVTAFQNALLEKANLNVTMLDLTEATITYVDSAFEMLRSEAFVLPELLEAYREMFMKALHWRANALHGGGVLEDFLTGTDTLYQFILSAVPAIAFGSVIVGRDGFRPGEGIGVDIVNLFLLRDVVNSLLYGNTACPLHRTTPRSCAVSAHELCLGFPSVHSGDDRCGRETALKVILKTVKSSALSWT